MDAVTSPMPSRTLAGFGLLLALLLIDLVIVIGVGEPSAVSRATQLVVAAATLALAGFGSRVSGRLSWTVTLVAATVVVLGIFVLTSGLDEHVPGATEIAAAGLYGIGALACSARVLRQERVSLETILGALSVYLLLAFAFGAVFSAIQAITGEPFFTQLDGPAGVADFLYFSLVTLTTLGYGDLTSGLAAGRAASALEAVVGQLFLATFVARTVGAFATVRRSGEDA